VTAQSSSSENTVHVGDDRLDIELVLRFLLKRKVLVTTVSVLCALASLAVTLVMDRVYRVESLMVAVAQEPTAGAYSALGQLGGIASLVGLDVTSGTSPVDEAIATMKSRTLTEQFISENELLPVLFSEHWDSETGNWRVHSEEKVPTLWDGYKLIDEQIRRVSQDKVTGLVTISISWTDRHQAVRWAEDLVLRTNEQMRRRTINDLSKSIEFLKEELESTNVLAIREAISRIMEGQIQQIAIANTREQFSFRVIDPPVEPDADDYVWPNHIVFTVLGFLGGFGLCILFAIWRTSRRSRRAVEVAGAAPSTQ
jgi:uncharacterized protein involved in exopolysaccharide biosynthesis